MERRFDYIHLRRVSPIFRDGVRIRTEIIGSLVEQAIGGRAFRLLDIGTADGITLERLRARFPEGRFYGLDPRMDRILAARPQGLDVVRGIGERLPFASGSFRVVTIAATLKHIPHHQAVLRECRRVLGPDGWFILVDPTPWGIRVGVLFGHFPRGSTPSVWSARRAAIVLSEHGLAVRRVTKFMLLPRDYPGRKVIEPCLRRLGLGGLFLQQAILSHVDPSPGSTGPPRGDALEDVH
jgi:SAM-dependent methyltransferase